MAKRVYFKQKPENVSDTLNVLVVIDVQNCFMSNLNGGTFLNMDEYANVESQLKNAALMVNRISKLCTKTDLVCFTRDMHPLNHISFGSDDPIKNEGRKVNPPNTWPEHCRRVSTKCEPRLVGGNDAANKTPLLLTEEQQKIETGKPNYNNTIDDTLSKISTYVKLNNTDAEILIENIMKDENVKNKLVIGNELSYYFYGTELSKVVEELNGQPRDKVIALKSNDDDTRTLNEFNTTPEMVDNKYVQLWKGEKCNQESYSAFNYHIDYDVTDPANPKINEDFNSIDKQNSTGLFEYILSKINDNTKTINITLCGLVGDVCVMHSFLQGKALWENKYKTNGIECNFKIDAQSSACTGLVGIKPGFFDNETADDKENLEKILIWYKTNAPSQLDKNIITEQIFDFGGQPNTSKGGGKRSHTCRRHCRNCQCSKCCSSVTKKYKKKQMKTSRRRKPNFRSRRK